MKEMFMTLRSRLSWLGMHKTTRFMPRVEALETRYAPACTTTYLFSDVSVNCDAAVDSVDVNGTTGATYSFTINGVEKNYKVVHSIHLDMGSGNDTVRIMPTSK